MKHQFRTIKDYERRMRKAKYQAFWIRVRLWIQGHEGKLLMIAVIIAAILLARSI